MIRDSDVVVRVAQDGDIEEIHDILAQAFTPYRADYTEKAYGMTVVPVDEIKQRLGDSSKIVIVAQLKGRTVGTATVDISSKNCYIQSMAVRPDVQRKGIAIIILREIEKYARKKSARLLSLECYEPLTKAIRLYEECGFVRTGRTRSYYGISIFEMEKELRGTDDQ